ncbi:MAG TPA: hypothetical protein VFY10_01200 [Dehalococcoidia bacterium]|nr:hypothetical protein [Dehalococcoidia bacterium]
MNLSNREASHVLAALRNWQEETKAGAGLEDYFEAYFEEAEPLTSDEIDALCRRIAEAK